MKKLCNKCNRKGIVKNGKRSGVQRFLCKYCGYVFEHGNYKNKKNLNSEEIFENFVRDDLKYRQMSQTLDLSIRSVQRIIDAAPFKKTIVIL
ncbi:transposase-like zinc-binding domain-containing protein [Candidatus Absconditicoccus praedator]|uniref:transposase-like zinc-binding domain-containing protein n=1 Tax=Candidatus Absconditicoccus praedator TaxID=2735562 RepID=UPI001E2A4587|nr:hypothetical protein [Candidatus Absconditicoccus praedator]UFX83071.1 IS1 family transposase [Candidatus Absconditicoccus praedator]